MQFRLLSTKFLNIGALRLLVAAMCLHVMLALAIFSVGRAQLAPKYVDRNGIIPSFAFDSYEYQHGAESLVDMLRHGEFMTWTTAGQPVHVKLISISFIILGPLFGSSTLSAEPFNLLCYAGIIGMVYALGREIADRRVGYFAAAAVALWPSLLLHSLQLLKDPLFIILAIALIVCVATWITRTYSWRGAVVNCFITSGAVLLTNIIRVNFAVFIVGLTLLGLGLVVLRQLLERRMLGWNLLSPLPALVVAAILIPSQQPHTLEKFKQHPANHGGEQKLVAVTGLQLPGLIEVLPHSAKRNLGPSEMVDVRDKANAFAVTVSRIRSSFSLSYPDSGSTLDGNIGLKDWPGLISYLPRALEIGLWAPFPNAWISSGHRVGTYGKLLSAAEMVVVYCLEVLALFAIARSPRELPLWLLFLIMISGVTALGLLVPNIGALYRFRYTLWILLIILAMKGVRRLMSLQSDQASRQALTGNSLISKGSRASQTKLRILTVLLLSICCGCRSSGPSRLGADATAASPVASINETSPSQLDFTIVNYTGAPVGAVFISPTRSLTWEENIISGDKLGNGNELRVRFSANEQEVLWDLRLEGTNGRYVEYKELNLAEISKMTLRVRAEPRYEVVAQLE